MACWIGSHLAADPITLGPGTTVLDEPLRADGTIDYAAELNQRGQELEGSENAAVVLAALMGRSGWPRASASFELPGRRNEATPINEAYRAQVLERLGWPDADPGIDPIDHAALRTFDFQDDGWWQQPDAIDWLNAHQSALDAFQIGARDAEGLLWPWVPDDEANHQVLFGYLMPDLGAVRRWSQLLLGRARYRLASGDDQQIEAAWLDVLGVMMWGYRLHDQGPVLRELVAITVRQEALTVVSELIGVSSQVQLEQFERAFKRLPVEPSLVSVFKHERWMGLDAWQQMVAGRVAIDRESPVKFMALEGFDANLGLRELNQWYNRIEAVARIEDAPQRYERANRLAQDIKEVGDTFRAEPPVRLPMTIRFGVSLPGADQQLSDMTVSVILPDVSSVGRTYDQYLAMRQLTVLAFAQRRYFLEHQRYANDWDTLIEAELIEAVPIDPFDGQPVRLNLKDGVGCSIYVIGTDFDDDGGRSITLQERDPSDRNDQADIVVRLVWE